jgi:hypothetical protein
MEDPFRLYESQEEPNNQAPPQAGASQGRLGIIFIIMGILVALFVPIVGPLLALILGIIYRKSAGAIALIILGGFFLAVHLVFNILIPLFAIPTLLPTRYQAADRTIEDNLFNIMLAVENSAATSGGIYPSELDTIESLGTVARAYNRPINPITEDEMHNVPFGTEKCYGEYTYIPVAMDGKVKGYYLIAYGKVETEGKDVNGDSKPDHVISILSSQILDEKSGKTIPGTSDNKPLPPLKDLLKK